MGDEEELLKPLARSSVIFPMTKSRNTPEPRLAWAYVREGADRNPLSPTPQEGLLAARTIEVDGTFERHRLYPVSAWADRPPRQRPPSYCPICLEPVTLKLGAKLRHHYAHASTSTCRAATPEGALHLDAKLRLAGAFAGGGSYLTLRRICNRAPQDRSGTRCGSEPAQTVEVEWDAVEVEYALPSLRADLILLRQGTPVLAIEVFATHEVDDAKAEKYRSLGVPWLEVSGRHLLQSDTEWHRELPVPVLADSGRQPVRWRCQRHQGLWDAHLHHQANGVHTLCWRTVHIYRTDGGIDASRFRIDVVLLRMMERREGGDPVEAWLQRDEREDPLTRPLAVASRADARERLHRQFVRWVSWNRRTRGATIDSPMQWVDGVPPVTSERTPLHPQRYRVHRRSGCFVAPPGLPRLAWPLPLFERRSPHPIFGDAPISWGEPSTGDQPNLYQAIAPPCWVVLTPHEWLAPGRYHARADFTIWWHDGVRWRELTHAGFSHGWEMPIDHPTPHWEAIVRQVAEAAATNADRIARRKVELADLVVPILPA